MNRINPEGPGFVPVALLAPSVVPVTDIDRATLRFGDLGVETSGPSEWQ